MAEKLTGRQRHKRQRERLFARQKGRCYWCETQMSLDDYRPGRHTPDLATIDHLDDRFSPDRGTRQGEYRRVAACWTCNNRRAQLRQAAQPLADLHLRSGRAGRAALGDQP